MTINSIQPHSESTERNSSGVLFLKKPAGTENLIEWYSSKIAGVPFALRNLLIFQRVNIRSLAVFMEDPSGDLEKLSDKILKDSRISQNIVWIGNILQLKEWIQNNPNQVYIFNGSVLHDKNKLNRLINALPQNEKEALETFPVNLENLENLLLNDQNDLVVSPSTKSSEKPQMGSPIYVRGSKEAEIQKPEDFKTMLSFVPTDEE